MSKMLCWVGLHSSYYLSEGAATSKIKCRRCGVERVVPNHE